MGTKKQYIITKIMAGTTYHYEKLVGTEIIWNDDIRKAKIFEGCAETRKIRSGSGVPGSARWKIKDAPKK
jgi:hypothetical protein